MRVVTTVTFHFSVNDFLSSELAKHPQIRSFVEERPFGSFVYVQKPRYYHVRFDTFRGQKKVEVIRYERDDGPQEPDGFRFTRESRAEIRRWVFFLEKQEDRAQKTRRILKRILGFVPSLPKGPLELCGLFKELKVAVLRNPNSYHRYIVTPLGVIPYWTSFSENPVPDLGLVLRHLGWRKERPPKSWDELEAVLLLQELSK